MGREGVQQLWMGLGNLLEGQPLAAERKVDKPEGARHHHDGLLLVLVSRAYPLGEGLAVRAQGDRSLNRSALRRTREDAASHAGLLARARKDRADVAPGLVHGGRRAHSAVRERVADHLLERLAEALAERGA